jgi:hypothetical protein
VVYTGKHFGGEERPGTYTLFAALVRPGALQDNRIDPGDVVVLDVRPIAFSP